MVCQLSVTPHCQLLFLHWEKNTFGKQQQQQQLLFFFFLALVPNWPIKLLHCLELFIQCRGAGSHACNCMALAYKCILKSLSNSFQFSSRCANTYLGKKNRNWTSQPITSHPAEQYHMHAQHLLGTQTLDIRRLAAPRWEGTALHCAHWENVKVYHYILQFGKLLRFIIQQLEYPIPPPPRPLRHKNRVWNGSREPSELS